MNFTCFEFEAFKIAVVGKKGVEILPSQPILPDESLKVLGSQY